MSIVTVAISVTLLFLLTDGAGILGGEANYVKHANSKGGSHKADQSATWNRAFKISRPNYRHGNLYNVPHHRLYGVEGEGPKCYHCDSNSNSACIEIDVDSTLIVRCAPHHYCSVTRTETNQTKGCTEAALKRYRKVGIEPPEYLACKQETTTQISRSCMSNDMEEYLKENPQEGSFRTFQTCTTDKCNSGDGRLKCYACQGNGTDSCVSEPEKTARQTVCPPYENCHIVRREVTTGGSSQVYVTRGCRPFDYLPEDSDDDERVFTQSCSMDLCNSGLTTSSDLIIDDFGSLPAIAESLIQPISTTNTNNLVPSGLECYMCIGIDSDPCVLGEEDQRVNCRPDEECTVWRRHSISDDPDKVLVEVWRGCKSIDEESPQPEDPSEIIFSESCSTNLCNVGLSKDPNEFDTTSISQLGQRNDETKDLSASPVHSSGQRNDDPEEIAPSHVLALGHDDDKKFADSDPARSSGHRSDDQKEIVESPTTPSGHRSDDPKETVEIPAASSGRRSEGPKELATAPSSGRRSSPSLPILFLLIVVCQLRQHGTNRS